MSKDALFQLGMGSVFLKTSQKEEHLGYLVDRLSTRVKTSSHARLSTRYRSSKADRPLPLECLNAHQVRPTAHHVTSRCHLHSGRMPI
ncbi:MAG: hypothetical protein WC284_04595 [Candidimonas sp.]|jgi:hypothetical protein